MAEIIKGSNSTAAIDKISTGATMQNVDQPQVNDQPAGDTIKNGENMDLKIATAMRLGHVSNDLVDLEGGIKSNIILTEKDQTNTNNIINEAVEQKMAEKVSRPRSLLRNFPLVKPIVMSYYRTIAAGAVKKTGDGSSAFTKLGLEANSLTGTDNNESAQHSALKILKEFGFADKVDDTNTVGLYKGEKIEKIDDPLTQDVNGALKDLFSEIESAYKTKDDEAIKKAREAYNDKLEKWQNEGAFGDNQSNLGRKVLETNVVRFLIGDHSKRSVTEIEGLKKAADGVEDLVKHKVGSDAFNKYLDDGNLSLYSASMKEGLHTKQRVNNVLAAVTAGGVVGGIVGYFVSSGSRKGIKGQVAEEVGREALSNTAVGAVAGAAAGAALGAVRGVGHAMEKMSKAEVTDATSGEAIMTAEERAELAKTAATEAATKAAENTSESQESDAGEVASNMDPVKKAKFNNVLAKINKFKRGVTGEDKYNERISEMRNRKNAKDLYDTLEKDTLLLELANSGNKREFGEKLKEMADRKDGSSDIVINGIKNYLEGLKGKDKSEAKALKNSIDKMMKGELSKRQYGKLVDLLMADNFKNAVKNDMKDTIADIRARENLTNEKGTRRLKIDLIRYSEGNVDRERSLLREKMIEANKLLGEDGIKADGDPMVAAKVEELRNSQKGASFEQAKFIARQALVDAITGAMIGGASGAIVGKIKDLRAAKMTESQSKPEAATQEENPNSSTQADAANTPVQNVSEATTTGENINNQPQLVDEDGDGIYELKVGNEVVVTEGDGGITFDAETGKMSDSSLELLRSRGFEINETAETSIAHGARTTEGIYDYFKNSNAEAYGEGIETGNKITNIDIKGYLTAEGANRAVNITPAGVENDGDLVFQVTALPNSGEINVDNLQVVLTPSRDLGNIGVVLDVAPDGTVTVPADSVAASMFTQGNFSGGAMRVVQEVAGEGGGYNVLASTSGSGILTEVGFTNPIEKITYGYTVNGVAFNVPNEAQVESALARVGAESIRNSDPVEYTYQDIGNVPTDNIQGPVDFSPEFGRNYISVNGAAENNDFELIQMPHREGNYNEMLDPFLSDNKDGQYLLGQNLVRQMIDPDYEMTPEQADAAFIEALNDGRMSTNQVLHHILEAKGNSPEGIVSLRAKLGDFMYDIDGDGTEELVDTQEEINAVADMLKDSADGEGYSAFVNDTYERFFEKLNGGEIRVVNYAETPYTFTEHGFMNQMNNIIRAFARKKSTPTGIGLEFLDKDGKSIYDANVIRRIYRIPSGHRINMISDRLECGDDTQTTVRTTIPRIVRQAETQPENTTTPPTTSITDNNVPTTNGNPLTPSTPPTPAPAPEPEPGPEPEPEPSLAPKTDTNPWGSNNPAIMDEPTRSINENTVQVGQEVVPDANTEGINLAPEDQVSWAEAPTAPVEDTGMVPEDVSPDSDAAAAEMLRQTEEALKNENAA